MPNNKMTDGATAKLVDISDDEAVIQIKRKPGCLQQLTDFIGNAIMEMAKAGIFFIIGLLVGIIWGAS